MTIDTREISFLQYECTKFDFGPFDDSKYHSVASTIQLDIPTFDIADFEIAAEIFLSKLEYPIYFFCKNGELYSPLGLLDKDNTLWDYDKVLWHKNRPRFVEQQLVSLASGLIEDTQTSVASRVLTPLSPRLDRDTFPINYLRPADYRDPIRTVKNSPKNILWTDMNMNTLVKSYIESKCVLVDGMAYIKAVPILRYFIDSPHPTINDGKARVARSHYGLFGALLDSRRCRHSVIGNYDSVQSFDILFDGQDPLLNTDLPEWAAKPTMVNRNIEWDISVINKPDLFITNGFNISQREFFLELNYYLKRNMHNPNDAYLEALLNVDRILTKFENNGAIDFCSESRDSIEMTFNALSTCSHPRRAFSNEHVLTAKNLAHQHVDHLLSIYNKANIIRGP